MGGASHRGWTAAARLAEAFPNAIMIHLPVHASWLNQIEIWFSILVRKLLKRGNFTSVEDLEAQVRQFIQYYNRTMAKPFRWTYTGQPLTA